MADIKQQLHECRTRLYGMRSEMAVETVLLVAELELCALDQRLRRCTKDELDGLQGQVKVWQTIQKYIRESPTTTKGT